jgi:guanylate kinase
LILVVFGPGGAGKGTVVSALVQEVPGLWLSRSWTTRAQRASEPDDAYVFVDRTTFEAKVAEEGFLEWAEFLDRLYGTPQPEPPPGMDVVLEIDLQGAKQVRDRHPDAVLVLLLPPSRADQEARLVRRGDPPDRVRERLEIAAREEDEGRLIADHVVVNDELSRAVAELAGIVEAHRS